VIQSGSMTLLMFVLSAGLFCLKVGTDVAVVSTRYKVNFFIKFCYCYYYFGGWLLKYRLGQVN
jgi:hypothetical protein